MSVTDWVPDPRPVPLELTQDFTAPPYDPTLPFEHVHILDWNSVGHLLGPEGVKRLMRSVL